MLRRRPLARLCLLFLAGAALYVIPGSGDPWLPPSLAVLPSPLLFVLSGLAALTFLSPLPRGTGRRRATAPLSRRARAWIIVALGFTLSACRLQTPATDASRLGSAHLVTVEGAADSDATVTPYGVSFTVRLSRLTRETTEYRVTGKADAWIPRPFRAGRSWVRRLHLPHEGQRVAVTGVLEALIPHSNDREDSLRRHGILSSLKVGKGGSIVIPAERGSSVIERSRAISVWLIDGTRPYLSTVDRQVLSGMLFHQKGDLPAAVQSDLQCTGTVHILATAGLHVGIILTCSLVALCFSLPRRGAVIVSMALLAGYCIACGSWPAVFRATVIAELGLLAWLAGRLPDPLTCLSAAATWMVLRSPDELMDAGFQFTFLTVGVILLVMPLLEGVTADSRSPTALTRAAEVCRDVVRVSAAAQLGSWPLTAYYFKVISFIGVLANLLIVPMLMLIIPLALLTGVLGRLAPLLAAAPGAALHGLLSLLLATAHTLAHVPGGWMNIDPPSWSAIAAYYAVLIAGLLWLRSHETGTAAPPPATIPERPAFGR
ncbi:MAG: ComEC family competence protein [Chloroflexi bacterium]|nr:ComEC family competence protein [Chloroflexota bacterium]